MNPKHATILVLTDDAVLRVDLAEGKVRAEKSAPRPSECDLGEAVQLALALVGKKPARESWILTTAVWEQKVRLNPAQTAGLNPSQLVRALAFEVEPFSGIAVATSAVGYRADGNGAFSVVQMPSAEREMLDQSIRAAGSKLLGIGKWEGSGSAHSPSDWVGIIQQLSSGKLPIIAPGAKKASKSLGTRQWILITQGVALLALVIALRHLQSEKDHWQRKQDAFAATVRDLNAAKAATKAARSDFEQAQMEEAKHRAVASQRSALARVLRELANLRSEALVLTSIQPEESSTLLINGIALELEAVDEFSLVLNSRLQPFGWSALMRAKRGQQIATNGGPWDFSLAVLPDLPATTQTVFLPEL